MESKIINSIEDGWEWTKNVRELYLGSDVGKYLFFSPDINIIRKIRKESVIDLNFYHAKNNVEEERIGDSHVVCIYDFNNNRLKEVNEYFHKKYKNIRGAIWKTDADTIKGIYSKQYLNDLKLKNAKNN